MDKRYQVFVSSTFRDLEEERHERKAGSHMRVRAGMNLPADTVYFLESYEACLQFTEWLEAKLHERWHSSFFEEKQQTEMKLKVGG
jgi:hypothetical protein